MRLVVAIVLVALAVPAVAAAQEQTTVKLIQRSWTERSVYYDAAASTDNKIDAYVLEASIRPDRLVHVAIIPKVLTGGATPERMLDALAGSGTVVLAVDDDVYARSEDFDVEPMVARALREHPGDTQAVLRGVLLDIANEPTPASFPWWLWVTVPVFAAGVAVSAFTIVRRRRVA